LNIFFLPAVGCIVQTNFYDDLFIATISPFVLFALVAITLYLITLRAKSLNHRNPYYTPRKAWKDAVAAAFLISYFTLIDTSTKIFEVFQCETFDDGSSYLVADYSINCNAPGRYVYIIYGILMIFIYPIGIPFVYAVVLIRNRHEINPDWRRVVAEDEKAFVSNSVIQQEKIKVRNTYESIKNIKFLYDSYTPKRWYFELIDCGRRLMLGAIPVLILRGSSLQIVIVLIISLASVAAFMYLNPYIHAHDNELAILAQWSITMVVVAALVV
jgi:hypothetical protein